MYSKVWRIGAVVAAGLIGMVSVGCRQPEGPAAPAPKSYTVNLGAHSLPSGLYPDCAVGDGIVIEAQGQYNSVPQFYLQMCASGVDNPIYAAKLDGVSVTPQNIKGPGTPYDVVFWGGGTAWTQVVGTVDGEVSGTPVHIDFTANW